jgi:alkylation response protein AidB-like acyl-CoA dehydrogenase
VPGGAGGAGIGLVGPTLIAHGTEEQKKRYLPRILTAEELWCELYSEPNAGSDLASLRTSAERRGDEYVVNGGKIWTSGGLNADLGILLARTDPSVPKHEGISYFIIDMHTPGVEVHPLRQITGNAEFCQVFFTDVRIPAENLIGHEGQGWRGAQTTLGFERGANVLAGATGRRDAWQRLATACRSLGPDGQPRLNDPLVRQKLGQMLVDVEVMRAGGLRVLSKLEKGQRPGAESSIDKLFSSETAKVHQELQQDVLGPFGQLEADLPESLAVQQRGSTITGEPVPDNWAYSYLWSRCLTILAGSSEIQRGIVGERLLGLPRDLRMDRFPAPVREAIAVQERRRGQRD